jgi:phenylacetate-coenzyme A ligase PaaK-like adenylate-forming protein
VIRDLILRVIGVLRIISDITKMKIKSFLAKPFAGYIYKQIKKGMETAVEDQQSTFNQLIKTAAKTEFGKEHGFADIKTYEDFVKQVPIRDYEAFKVYIERIKEGKHNVLWKGQPIYFAKTSGTTSGVKYIPISKDSIPNHINTARNALLCYMAETGNTKFADGKLIFLSGSPTLERVGGIPTGRLSGIVNHHVPKYLRANQLPSYTTNCIEEWEEKLDKIVEETINQNMTLISGIPPWMQMYFDRLQEKSGKKISKLFPDFSVMVQGGVNFEPYKAKLFESIGKKIDCIELFPASEGFFAFQDSQNAEGLLLNTNSGIFYEFVAAAEIFKNNPTRLSLKDVQVGENYALIINNNAGLWGYNIGDTVKFVSTNPYRIVVTGRTKHFISAFGEHVIGEEVEAALLKAAEEENVQVTEFTVAPMIAQDAGKSYHEWFIEFENTPTDMAAFAKKIDDNLRTKNVYYDDLIAGNILQQLKISTINKNGFIDYMKSIGKLGGQNKMPRLSNDRKIAEALMGFIHN